MFRQLTHKNRITIEIPLQNLVEAAVNEMNLVQLHQSRFSKCSSQEGDLARTGSNLFHGQGEWFLPADNGAISAKAEVQHQRWRGNCATS